MSSRIAPALALLLLGGCTGEGDGSPTFSRDIAPILFQHCASCHHPEGIAPFSVLAYDEVEARAERIAQATSARTMPPWQPAHGYVEFLNDPSLADEEIDLIVRWVEGGAPEGRRADLPEVPHFDQGWRLGVPDVLLEGSESYLLLPAPTDIYRTFVLPVPLSSTRYVRAIEFRPVIEPAVESGSMPVGDVAMPVHHAVLMVDRTSSSRRLDAQDPELGFESTSSVSQAHAPDGFFLGWTPGNVAAPAPAGLAWRLDPETDLVIQVHMQPVPEPVRVRVEIGLYFTDEAPARVPSALLLHSMAIDIPAGENVYVVEDSLELPVDVEVLSIYPHAHFLAREMDVFAIVPDGSRRWLIRIDDWDFNWQDAYHYAEPIHLPQGSVVHMRYTYDNSPANPQNPHDPPRRTTFGPNSTDEMAEVFIQVLTRDTTDRENLERALTEKAAQSFQEVALFAIQSDPDDPQAHYNFAVLLNRRGARDEAAGAYRRALELREDYPAAHSGLGSVLMEAGNVDEAIRHLRRATELEPEYAYAHLSLANALAVDGDAASAETQYRRAIDVLPEYARAHFNLANLLRDEGRLPDAETEFRRTLELDPDLVPAHFNLANLLGSRGQVDEAIVHYRAALEAEPGFVAAHVNLGFALGSVGRVDEAIDQYRAAISADPASPLAHFSFGNVLYSLGRFGESAAHYRRTVELQPSHAQAHYALGNTLSSMGQIRAALEHLRAAVELDPEAPEPALALETALSALADPDVRDPSSPR